MINNTHGYERGQAYADLPHTVTVPEIALMCNVTRQGVLEWLQKGKLKGRQAPNIWLVEKSDLLSFANKNDIVLAYEKREQEI